MIATLEAAADRGILCLHHRAVPGTSYVIDHLVVAPNGLWVVTAAPEPSGRVEKRDLGDWFSSEPRLFVGGSDASRLHLRAQHTFDAVEAALADSVVDRVPRQGVLCFVDNHFTLTVGIGTNFRTGASTDNADEALVAAFDAVEAALADSVVDRVPRQGVLCFVDVAPAWFTRTFELERITVTWRRLLVDPMLSVTTYGPQTRLELIRHLDARFPSA